MTWRDPDDHGREILERSPGRWSRALARAEALPRWLRLAAAAAALAVIGVVVLVTQSPKHPTGALHGSSPVGAPVPAGAGQGPIPGGPDNQATSQQVATACGSLVTKPGHRGGLRMVLGDVAVPPAYVPGVQRNGNGVWRYYQQTAILVRGESPPVTVSVPPAWQARVAIDLEVHGIGTMFHLPSCPGRGAWSWNVAGFYTKTPTACVPLRIQVGRRADTVWFGLGARCPAQRTGVTR